MQFSKHHVPEVHPKDTDDYIERRVREKTNRECDVAVARDIWLAFFTVIL